MRLKLVFVFILLVLVVSCFISGNILVENKNVIGTSDETEQKSLQLIEVSLPKYFAKPINLDELNIKYTYNNSNSICLRFNNELKENDEYIFGYFERDSYNEICRELDNDKYTFFNYDINKNRIDICSSLSSGYPGDMVSIYIPCDIEDIYGNKLNNDEILIFSRYKANEDNIYSSTNYILEREMPSKILVKQKNDNKSIYYLNENTNLYADESMKDLVMNLYKGETVLLKKADENICNVDIYMYDENSENPSNKNVINGYMESSKLTEVPEPLNDGVSYLFCITSNSESGSPVVEFNAINELYGSESMCIEEDVKSVDKEDLYKLECSILFSWPAYLMGNSSFCSYSVSNEYKQGYVSRYDIESHIPEYYWEEHNYNTFCKAFNMLTDYIIGRIKTYHMTEGMGHLNERLIESCKRFRVVEQTWVDWAYKEKLSKNYFFDEILNRLSLTESEINEMKLKFEEVDNIEPTLTMESFYVSKESAISDELFGYKYNEIHNNILLDSEVSKCYSDMVNLLRSKYTHYDEYEDEIHDDRDNDTTESGDETESESSDEEIEETLIWGKIISVTDGEDLNFIVEDEDGNQFHVRIAKSKRDEIELSEGDYIRTASRLIDGIYEVDARDCFVY